MKTDDRFIKFLKRTMKTILIYLVIIIVITQFVIRPFRVDGESMSPTIKNGELGISNIIGYRLNSVDRFDVVIVHLPNSNKYLFKRVIGLPNETLEFIDDVLYIDGKAIEENFLDADYVKALTNNGSVDFTEDFGPIKLGADDFFLMGDNRPRSSDSRDFGPFSSSQIKSKNGIIFFPFNGLRFLGR